MNAAVVLAVFPVIFVGELPDKTMFASLVLASCGKPLAVWAGAAGAFLVHVVIATTIGAGIFAVLSPRAVDVFVAVLFAAGAVYAFWESNREDEQELVTREALTHRRVLTTAFVVIFVAEWGDLTQILTANLAAHYHDALERRDRRSPRALDRRRDRGDRRTESAAIRARAHRAARHRRHPDRARALRRHLRAHDLTPRRGCARGCSSGQAGRKRQERATKGAACPPVTNDNAGRS